MLLVAALVLWLTGTYEGIVLGLAGSGVLAGLFFPLLRLHWIVQWARQLANQAARDGLRPVTLTLTEDAFRVRGEVTDTTARWEKMKGIAVGEDYTFILISDQLGTVIPSAALGDDARYAAVRDFAAARLPALPS